MTDLMQAGNKYVGDHPDEAGIIDWWKKRQIITQNADENSWVLWGSFELLCAVLVSITSSRSKRMFCLTGPPEEAFDYSLLP